MAAAALLAGGASAQEPNRQGGDRRPLEGREMGPPRGGPDAMFARIDANHDGVITKAEFDAGRRMGPGGRGGPHGGPGGMRGPDGSDGHMRSAPPRR